MNFIKLTQDDGGKAAYVWDLRISCIIENDDYSDVYLQGDSTPLSVKETPEQILSLLFD